MNKMILVESAILGISSVALGAFAAHGLNESISAEALSTFETGVRYQMYYAILLLVIGWSNKIGRKNMRLILILTTFGVLFFSGSIYGLATNSITAFNFKSIAIITPIGGLLLILVWVVLLLDFLKIPKTKPHNF